MGLTIGLPRWHNGKVSACQCRGSKTHGINLWAEKSPRVGNGNLLIFMPRKFHGQRTLVGYSPWGRKETHDSVTGHIHTHMGLTMGWLKIVTIWSINPTSGHICEGNVNTILKRNLHSTFTAGLFTLVKTWK